MAQVGGRLARPRSRWWSATSHRLDEPGACWCRVVAEVAIATVDHSDIRGSEPHNRDPSLQPSNSQSPVGSIPLTLAMGSRSHPLWNVVFPKLMVGVRAKFSSPVTATYRHRATTPSTAAASVPFVVSLAKRSSSSVENRLMQPYYYDNDVGIQELKHDWRLSQEDINTIVAWVDQGALLGNPDDMPPPANLRATDDWSLAAEFGPPDILAPSTPIDVPAAGP